MGTMRQNPVQKLLGLFVLLLLYRT